MTYLYDIINTTFLNTVIIKFANAKKQTYPYFLSIVIPVFNEEYRIKNTLLHIQKIIQNISYEILIINDGSTDNTKNIIEPFLSKNIRRIDITKNKGKGFAIKTGFLHANGKYILMTDVDLSTPIETIFEIENKLKQYDIIIGSRTLDSKKTVVQGPISRIFLRKASITLRKLIFNINITDTQCGFKVFTNKSAKHIAKKMTINRYGADLEKIIIAKYLGYRIKEVPVSWFFDHEHTKIRLIRDSIQTLREWIKIKINIHKNFY